MSIQPGHIFEIETDNAPTVQGVLAGRAIVQIYISRPYRVHFNAEKPLAKIVKRVYDADGKRISKFALDASGEWREIPEGEPLPPECIFELDETAFGIIINDTCHRR